MLRTSHQDPGSGPTLKAVCFSVYRIAPELGAGAHRSHRTMGD